MFSPKETPFDLDLKYAKFSSMRLNGKELTARYPWQVRFSERAASFKRASEYWETPSRTRSGKPTQTVVVPTVATPKFGGSRFVGSAFDAYHSKADFSDILKTSQRLGKQFRAKSCKMELQADKIDLSGLITRHVDADVLSLTEDLALLIIQLIRSRDKCDKLYAVLQFLKMRTGKSLLLGATGLLSEIINDVNSFELQGDNVDTALDAVTDFRGFLTNWEKIQDSAIVVKAMKVYKLAVALGVFAMVGVKLDEDTIRMCKKEVGAVFTGPNFLLTLADFIALLVQRALMFAKTGEWSTLLHGPTTYGKWYDTCQELKRQHLFVGNLEAHGTNYHEFVNNLTGAIETGRSIMKFGEKTSGFETLTIKKLLNEMLLIQADMFTYSAAQKARRPPFGLLVFGGSSVVKSTFVEMLFQYMGRVLSLPTEEEFKYSRNPSDQFWSGWNSAKWFIHLDDVAYVNPNANTEDNSLMEIIQLVNDVVMVPNQARLEDKGKNPVRARAVVATTNTKHLNAQAHFACPLAVQRRLPFVITVEPKPEYARADAPGMIDPSKLPLITEDWPDFWIITVEKVIPAANTTATFEKIHMFSDVNKFLDWLRSAMELFEQIQAKAGSGTKAMKDFKLCDVCMRNRCICGPKELVLQGRTTFVPGLVVGQDHDVCEIEDGKAHYKMYEYCLKDGYNYMCTYVTLDELTGEKLSEHISPVLIAAEAPPPKEELDEVAMADVLSEIVRLQALKADTVVTKVGNNLFQGFIRLYIKSGTVRWVVHTAMGWRVVRKLASIGLKCVTYDRRPFFEFCGTFAQNVYMNKKWKYVLAGLASFTVAASAYGIYNHITKHTAEEQGLRLSVPDSHFPKSERENVWKRDDYETSSIDRTPMGVSYADLPRDQLVNTVRRNVARMIASDGVTAREGNILCVGGHLWVTNNHLLHETGDVFIQLKIESIPMGASPNTAKTRYRQHEIFRQKGSDLAWIMVYNWESKKDLRGLIPKQSFNGKFRGSYTGYDKQVGAQTMTVAAVMRGVVNSPIGQLDAWNGYCEQPTELGFCGMPLIVHQPTAGIIGLHTLGSAAGEVWATTLDQVKMADAIAYFDMPMVQGSAPELSSASAPKLLGPLSQYSALRWLETGSVKTFGSFQGYAPTPRSKVRPTLLGEEIEYRRDWSVDAVRPEMRDWRPWRLALTDITMQPHGAMDMFVVKECARAYVDDVVSKLTPEQKASVQVLSTRAAINGIVGVKYVDKMNFKSSMGEPWRKTKKQYLQGSVGEMEFTPEIMERVAAIEEKYSNGVCVHPVFCGQIKDEPRSQAKVDLGKLRIISGAPADWSLVVRKYLLTFVKLIQENPFLFEASPGCTVQSLEWEQYYDFLTKFGLDRLVAGDYGKFDKKMLALLIIMAFWEIAEILKACGWSEEEVVIVACIGEDIAYAYTNFNGDLVQFFGSNPSGQPLTVIINCMVNALYMRYCFTQLDPRGMATYDSAKSFKDFVSLLTYGDDNAMGVSRSAPWFNHTSIQATLKTIGVEYTMADKESASEPYIHIGRVSYLKRTWRWCEEIGAVVCPLERSSIFKMLTVCCPSSTDSPEFHMASVMVSAANEWFWYGRKKFEKERAWLVALAEEFGLEKELAAKNMPTWDELVLRFWNASDGMTTARLSGCSEEHPRTVVPN